MKWEGMWKESVMAYIEVLPRYLRGGTEENLEKLQPG
jgi:hypothetical protein